jgi:8-amino-7-oxononanoate synthase
MNPLSWLDDALADLNRRSLRRVLTVRQGSQRGDEITIGQERLVNFGSNDYLGLAASEELTAAAAQVLSKHGWGSGASPLVTGRGELHAALERELADWEQTEATLLFPSGFAANLGIIPSLVGKPDAVYSDERNHASIIDGCRLSGAAIHIYRHCDAEHLQSLLTAEPTARRKLIVTDTVFSMDGDLAPLERLVGLAREHDAMLMVDEAHATGVFGAQGRGLCEQLGVQAGVHIKVGTLSKALGASGGFVAGSQNLIDWLANRARPYVFSTATPEANAAAALAALHIVRSQPQRRQELLSRAAALRDRLRSAGLNVGRSASQIIPVILGSPEATMKASALLRQRGFFVPSIRPPTVPEGQSLLRISLTWRHTPQQIVELRDAVMAVCGP